MSLGPGLARRLLVSTEHKDYRISAFRNLHRLCDPLRIQRRIPQHDFIGIPVGLGLSDLAAKGVEHLGIGADFIFNSLQDAYPPAWVVTVATEVELRGIRTNDGNLLKLRLVERKDVILVFQ